MEPKTIYLKDYTPSPYQIDSVELFVDIFEDKTIVDSRLHLVKRNKGEAVSLELNGEVKFIEAKVDGVLLKAHEFEVTKDKLIIQDLKKDKFILEVKNEINPAENTSAEGFYQSGEQLCTQCEAEGFRKITYYIDRPDVMSKFKTKMIADKKKYPHLLSNGNRLGSGDLPHGRHWVEWQDPFRKPCYLFAMVAGDFDVARDTFTTMKGRKVGLELYVDKGNLDKTSHAIHSLQTCMKWDEDVFGLEYDLDLYMIVAVDSFNMGAMENKGLNIFNSTYALANQKTATDADFQNIEGVIGHEYFHNWTGNRVTCRDWFQLTLKEGLTVFRDQEFSADMLSRAVKRLEDVRTLKERQFAEDAGPLSHPIRPSSYIEINNFYTATIYEKGAEVIRMIETLIGKQNFRKGMDKYFELFDGMAVTTEDFVHAMEVASGKDLTQFKNWYSRPGTPTLIVTSEKKENEFILHIEQRYPETKLDLGNNILHMPFKVAMLIDGKMGEEKVLELTKLKESFSFKVTGKTVIPSLNRNFSAPVNVEYPYEFSDLLTLMSFENDPYSRYEATQQVYDKVLKAEFNVYKATGNLVPDLKTDFKEAFKALLNDSSIDLSFKSYLLDLPTESALAQEIHAPDFDGIHLVRKNLKKKLGLEFQDWFLKTHESFSVLKKFELTPVAYGERALKNQALSFLVASESSEALKALENHYEKASNMTEEIQGLMQYVRMGVELTHPAIQSFYSKWKHDSLVMLKWFGALASYTPKEVVLKRLEELEKNPAFEGKIPNFMRSLYMSFGKNNLNSFHATDGSGYQFIARKVVEIDKLNPQVASRLAQCFSLVQKVDLVRQTEMKKALKSIMSSNPSKDTFEVVSKYLN